MPPSNQRTVITIGNFDGVHLGHQLLVNCAVAQSVELGAGAVAVTFEPHPTTFFRGSADETFRIQTPDARDATLRSMGISAVDRISFGEALTAMSPEAFIGFLEARHPRLAAIHVGEDFRFGAKRAGDTSTLKELGDARGFAVAVHPAVRFLDEVVSSSRLRDALRVADMDLVRAMLGRDYAIEGSIEPGHGRGRVLGVPTLNLYPAGRLLPAQGVYVATIRGGGQSLPAVANLGVRPTFADDPRVSLEAHALVDFEPLEGPVEVLLHAYLRPEKRFDDPAALREQIGHDIAAASAWHAANASR